MDESAEGIARPIPVDSWWDDPRAEFEIAARQDERRRVRGARKSRRSALVQPLGPVPGGLEALQLVRELNL